MSALEEYQDYARHATVGHNYATIGGLRVRADAAIAELEAINYDLCTVRDDEDTLREQRDAAEAENKRLASDLSHELEVKVGIIEHYEQAEADAAQLRDHIRELEAELAAERWVCQFFAGYGRVLIAFGKELRAEVERLHALLYGDGEEDRGVSGMHAKLWAENANLREENKRAVYGCCEECGVVAELAVALACAECNKWGACSTPWPCKEAAECPGVKP